MRKVVDKNYQPTFPNVVVQPHACIRRMWKIRDFIWNLMKLKYLYLASSKNIAVIILEM